MSETELQDNILAMCKRFGLLSYHTHDSRRSTAGFLDLVIVGKNGLLFRELKSAIGKVTTEQQTWLDILTNAGADAAVWRPVDWPTRITAELQPLGRCVFERTLSQAEIRAYLAKRVTKSPG